MTARPPKGNLLTDIKEMANITNACESINPHTRVATQKTNRTKSGITCTTAQN